MDYHQFFRAFIPLLVAIDVIAIVPLFLGLTEGMKIIDRKRLISQASLTALVIALVIIVAGKMLFEFLRITENDFRIGGGIVLLVLAVTDLVFSSQKERRRCPDDDPGVVPIGIPLIMGPAAMTTIIILVDSYGYLITLLSLVANLALVWLVFRQARWIVKVLGQSGTKAVAKVASLFLAAIAVSLIRAGVANILKS